jgi:hypothetical protein
MLPVSAFTHSLFILLTLACLFWVIWSLWKSPHEAARKSANAASLLLLMWCIFQSTLALNKWYMDRLSTPPHITFAIVWPTFTFLALLLIPYTRRVLDGLTLFHLTAIHIIRIPVEITLWLLYAQRQVPQSMTFEGSNFDIIMGLTAIPIAYMVFRQSIQKKWLIAWNILGIGLLVNIVITAIGAAPTTFQWRDFAQPNFAVTHFPFIWLPSFIVPVVLFGHILSLWKLLRKS